MIFPETLAFNKKPSKKHTFSTYYFIEHVTRSLKFNITYYNPRTFSLISHYNYAKRKHKRLIYILPHSRKKIKNGS